MEKTCAMWVSGSSLSVGIDCQVGGQFPGRGLLGLPLCHHHQAMLCSHLPSPATLILPDILSWVLQLRSWRRTLGSKILKGWKNLPSRTQRAGILGPGSPGSQVGPEPPSLLSVCLGGRWWPIGLWSWGQMDSGWGVILGQSLRQITESRRVLPCHQIQQMDQDTTRQWGSLRPPCLCLAFVPVLAAAAPHGSLISRSLLLAALLLLNGATSSLHQGHGSLFNKNQGGERAAPGRRGPALASQWGGMWWMTRPWVIRRRELWPRRALELGTRVAGIKFVQIWAGSVLFSGWLWGLGVGGRAGPPGINSARRLPRVGADGFCYISSAGALVLGKGLGLRPQFPHL